MAGLTEIHTVFISVGSNLGDKLGNCLNGIDALAATDASQLKRVSRFYQTSPVDYTDQDWFVNAAVELSTRLTPSELLVDLQAIQRRMGRKADTIRFGPRVIDLDILLYDDQVVRTAELEIPHPRMHKRAFVLQPICDINPSIVHPVLGQTAADLLASLEDTDQQVVIMPNQPALSRGRMP